MVYIVCFLTATVILAAYSGVLISFIAIKQEAIPINDLDELLHSGAYKFHVLWNSTELTFFRVILVIRQVLLGSYVVGFEVLTAVVTKRSVSLFITPCRPLKVSRHFEGTYRLHLQGRKISRARNQHESTFSPAFTLISCSAYSSTLKIEAICSSETSFDFQGTTQRYIPDDRSLVLILFSCSTLTSTLKEWENYN
jgi:hypothetical protein